MMRRSILAAAAVALSAGAAGPVGGDSGVFIGWRGDGTGVFPDDCRIVSEWSEKANVVWKTALPNAGNGSPIVVGRKALVMCEPGWQSDCPVLVCLDADRGRILWQREVDHFDLLPADEQASAKALRAKWFEFYRTGMRYTCQLSDGPKEQAEAVQARMKADGIEKFSFGQIRLTREQGWAGQFAKDCGWPGPTWGFLVIGTTFPTPASDGRHVYVVTAFNTVACYDLEGGRRWIRWFRDDKLQYHEVACFAHSPLLVDGRLVVEGNHRLRALDPATGEVLWDEPTGMQLYMVATPVVLRLPGAGGGEATTVICTASGQVRRLSDGRLLAEKIGLFAAGAGLVSDGRDRIFGVNGRSGGHYKCPEDRLFAAELAGHLIGVRLQPEGPDRVRAELLWQLGYKGESAPVFHRGFIFKGGSAVSAEKGAMAREIRHRPPRVDQGWILADGKLIGLRHTGEAHVVNAASLKPLATNQLDMTPPSPTREKLEQITSLSKSVKPGAWYVWSFGRSMPFASGNRLFIRSFDALYAIGDRGAAFRPSKAFAPEP